MPARLWGWPAVTPRAQLPNNALSPHRPPHLLKWSQLPLTGRRFPKPATPLSSMKVQSFQERVPALSRSAVSGGWFPGRQPAEGEDEDVGSWILGGEAVMPATLVWEAFS